MPVIGPNLDVMRERAKALVADHFVRIAEDDGTPATLRACYVLKATYAEMVLAGGSSPWIDTEAEKRGYTSFEMARIIAYMADESMSMEMDRTDVNVAIERAGTAGEIVAILAQLGITFTA